MEQFLWVELYRPKSINACILPTSIKDTFFNILKQQNVPNLLLTGPAGIGKTSVAKALLEELQADYIVINGSLNGNIDTLRNEIRNFASTISFTGGRKYVILDEADYLNAQSTQPALRNFMEEYSNNCGFILTCNYPTRIIKELHSRCSVIEFVIPKEEREQMASQFLKRACFILKENNITYNNKAVADLIIKYFPDWRRVLNELQRYSVSGNLDVRVYNTGNENIKEIVKLVKEKNFDGMRKWIALNQLDTSTFIRQIYDESKNIFKDTSIPQLVLILANYQYKAAFVADQEINLVACLTEIMADCEVK